MVFNPTEKLLLACATTAGNPLKINGTIDWEYLIRLGAAHQILPLLYCNLKGAPVPEEIKSRLKEKYLSNLIWSLRLEAQMNKIIKMLEEQGIDCIPLKGTAFARQVYGDIALRQTSDIDILVREKDLFHAKERLIKHGFQRVGYSDEYYLKDSCHLVFSNGIYLLELHWNIISYNNTGVSADFLWQGRAFSPELLLAFMVLKFNSDSFCSIRYLVDVAEILCRYKAEMDWEKFGKIIKIYRAEQVFYLCLRLIEKLFGKKYSLEEMRLSRPAFFRQWLLILFPAVQMIRKPGYKYIGRLLFLDRYREVPALVWRFVFPHPNKG